METMYYIGLDVHKKTIDYCVKDGSGRIYAVGSIRATRLELDMWMKTLPRPWTVAMEATIFTAWIYDHLKPHAAAVKVANDLFRRDSFGLESRKTSWYSQGVRSRRRQVRAKGQAHCQSEG